MLHRQESRRARDLSHTNECTGAVRPYGSGPRRQPAPAMLRLLPVALANLVSSGLRRSQIA